MQDNIATQAEAEAASARRAEELADAFNKLSGYPEFPILVQRLQKLVGEIKDECIRTPDAEAVRWYQAEFAVLETLIRFIGNATREPAESASADE